MGIIKKLPSFSLVVSRSWQTMLRFPATILSAVVATIAALMLVDIASTEEPFWLCVLMSAALGVPLGAAIVLSGERRSWSVVKSSLMQAIGLLLQAGYFFSLPFDLGTSGVQLPAYVPVRFALLFLGLHFLVAFLPFIRSGSMHGFWQFNKSLFLRYLVAALYSAVLFVGIALALAAVDNLFGADIKPETYFRLWIIIVGLFHPMVFLAGVPADLAALDSLEEYPKGLKVFTQFILLPLVGLYFVILIAYEVKIIVEWEWPTGWVAELVLWFSVVGILSLLLLYPLREKSDNKWIRTYITWYFRSSVPLIILLLFAILVRISDYGVTINRYLVLAMALGLIVVTGYFLFSRTRDIRIIPIVICIIALGSAYGPWSAFAVSLRSQSNRLNDMLTENGLRTDGVLVSPPERIPDTTQQEMSSIVQYLSEFHGYREFDRWVNDSVMAVLDTSVQYRRPNIVASALGFTYMSRWVTIGPDSPYHLSAEQQELVDIAGYDHLIRLSRVSGVRGGGPVLDFSKDSLPVSVPLWCQLDGAASEIEIWQEGALTSDPPDLVIDLEGGIRLLLPGSYRDLVPPDSLTFYGESDRLAAKVMLEYVNGVYRNDSLTIQSVGGIVLVREKD